MDIIKSLRLRYLSAGIVDEDRFSVQRWRALCQILALVAQNINNNNKKGKMVMCGGQVRWWTAWLPSRGRFCNWSVERFTSRRFGRQRQPVIVDGTKPTNISADITRHARPHSSPFGQRTLYSPFTALIVFRHRSNQTPRSATDDAASNLFLVARFCCCCHFPLGYFRDAIWMFVLWTSSLVPHNTVDIKQS